MHDNPTVVLRLQYDHTATHQIKATAILGDLRCLMPDHALRALWQSRNPRDHSRG